MANIETLRPNRIKSSYKSARRKQNPQLKTKKCKGYKLAIHKSTGKTGTTVIEQ